MPVQNMFSSIAFQYTIAAYSNNDPPGKFCIYYSISYQLGSKIIIIAAGLVNRPVQGEITVMNRIYLHSWRKVFFRVSRVNPDTACILLCMGGRNSIKNKEQEKIKCPGFYQKKCSIPFL